MANTVYKFDYWVAPTGKGNIHKDKNTKTFSKRLLRGALTPYRFSPDRQN